MTKILIKICIIVSLFFSLLIPSASAQIRVAITEFKNESGEFYLDRWENNVPDLLQSQLSQSENLIVLDRRKLKAVLEEKALALSGLTEAVQAKEIGTLLNAEYVISGSIHKFNERYRIDASIVKVSTAQVQTEKAVAPDREHLPKMVELLSTNIDFMLTGKGNYKSKIQLKKYPTRTFLFATIGLAVATGISRGAYEKNLENYQNNTELNQFDDLYKKANGANKLSIALGTFTGAALVGTLYCWIRNRSPKEIYASEMVKKRFRPYLTFISKNEVRVGAQIFF